jgi:hypothetical protein
VPLILGACSAPKPTAVQIEPDAGHEKAVLGALQGNGQAAIPDDEAILSDEAFVPSCESGKGIYLLTPDNHLLIFEPLKLEIKDVGRFVCNPDYQVFSMAIQRDGTAWVNHADGNIYKLDTHDLECLPSGHDPTLSEGHGTGMAFVRDNVESDSETLFLAEWWGAENAEDGVPGKLLAVDPTTAKGRVIGTLGDPISSRGCELTGTGDGVLAAFCPRQLYESSLGDDPFKVYFAIVDKQSASVKSSEVVPFHVSVGDFAMAAWGGEYYVFTRATENTTGVDVFVPGKGSRRLDVTFPYLVYGAGVSTCAPVATRQVR